MIDWLKGKKTYIAAILSALGFLLSYLAGDITLQQFLSSMQVSVLAVFLRSGITTDTNKPS